MTPGARGLAAGLVLSAGLLAPAGAAHPDSSSARRAEPRTVLGIVREGGSRLARLDARTLRPVSRRRVRVGDDSVASRSPDGTRVVLGNRATGSLTFVDVQRMRPTGHIWIGPDGPVAATAWPRPRSVVAAVVRHRFTHAASVCCARVTVVAADPVRRKIVRRTRLAADPVALSRWRGGLVMVLAPVARIGAARLAVVDAEGRVRSKPLARIRAGRNFQARRVPGLTVDQARGRAFVVGAGEPVAVVDLRRLAISYRRAERSPAARSKETASGPVRRAIWLGNGLLAVSGEEFRRSDFTSQPAGLVVVDTSTWRERVIRGDVASFWFGSGMLLGEPRDGLGLAAWSLAGVPRFRVFPGRVVERVEVVGDRAFVSLWGGADRVSSYTVVDLGTGAVLSEIERPLPTLVPR